MYSATRTCRTRWCKFCGDNFLHMVATARDKIPVFKFSLQPCYKSNKFKLNGGLKESFVKWHWCSTLQQCSRYLITLCYVMFENVLCCALKFFDIPFFLFHIRGFSLLLIFWQVIGCTAAGKHATQVIQQSLSQFLLGEASGSFWTSCKGNFVLLTWYKIFLRLSNYQKRVCDYFFADCFYQQLQ